MSKRSSTWCARLALALLALAGFAAPAAEREPDGVAQVEHLVVAHAGQPLVSPTERPQLPLVPPARTEQRLEVQGTRERLFLLHRAWLL